MLLQSALAVTILVQFCGSESIIESGCKGPGVFPHPYDSKQFLICANDHGKVFVAETALCPEGYVFSVSEKTCVRGQQSKPASPSTKSRVTRAAAASTCKALGPYCDDCDRLVVCASMGDSVLTAIANISCSEIDPGMTCSKASCTTTPGTTTQRCEGSEQAGAFRCLQPGFFPDPANCTLFHVCSTDLSHYSGECDEQFNANSGVCTSVDPDSTSPGTTSTKPDCKPLSDLCKGEKTAPVKFPSYPSYYAICIPVATKGRKPTLVYQVSVAKCSGSQVFNEKTQLCEITCSNGKRGRFADPDNCRSYFECPGTDNSSATKKLCPENNAFDKDRKLCLPESMVQGCQKTRAVEPSTTIATTINQANTPSSLPANKKIIPTVGFQCRASGVFPDETDCYKYISCSLESRSDGDYFRMRRKQCPFLTYFNPSGFCQLGFCWN